MSFWYPPSIFPQFIIILEKILIVMHQLLMKYGILENIKVRQFHYIEKKRGFDGRIITAFETRK